MSRDVPAQLQASRLMLQAYVDFRRQQSNRAIEKLSRALNAARGDADLTAEILMIKARVLEAPDPAAAAKLYRQIENNAPDKYRGLAILNRGHGLLDAGYYEPAVPVIEQAIALTASSGNDAANSVAVSNLAICLYNLGEYRLAEEKLQALVRFHRKLAARSLLSQSLAALGNLERDQGRFNAAAALLEEAVQGSATWDAAYHAQFSGFLAATLIQLGRLDEAEAHNAAAAFPPRNLNMGAIASARGDLERAARVYRQTLDEIRALVDQQSTPKEKESKETEYAESRWQAQLELARVYRKMRSPALMTQAYEESIRTIDRAHGKLLSTDFQLTFLTRMTRNYQEYAAVLLESSQPEKALAVEESSRARVLVSRSGKAEAIHPATRHQLQSLAAQTRSTLLGYWISPEGSHAWLITGSSFDCVPLAAKPADVTALVQEHQRMVVDQLRDVSAVKASAGSRLYELLVAPVAARLTGRVVVVPDGPLHQMNLETLVNTDDRYWLEDVTLATAPSFASIGLDRRRSGGMLLVGDAIEADRDYPRLQFASEEMHGIQALFPRATVLEGGAATPDAFLSAGPQHFDLIHFTAHAKANGESPLDSAVILSNSGNRYKLYARDVMSLPLSASLVTVSACRSAGARAYSGEGLVGFAWAFLKAGARNVIAGLWDVGDSSTSRLMCSLYSGIAKGQAPANALRAAKLTVMREGGRYGKPFYWAPFLTYTRERS